jgi:hypothetical protein
VNALLHVDEDCFHHDALHNVGFSCTLTT